MFKQSTKDNINGWGTVLRFITPVLVTISLWILGDMNNKIRDVRNETKELAKTTITYNTNHLEHHRIFEINICERLSSLETILKHER